MTINLGTFSHTHRHRCGLGNTLWMVSKTALELSVQGCWPCCATYYCKSLKSRTKVEWSKSYFTKAGASKMPAIFLHDLQLFGSNGSPWWIPHYIGWVLDKHGARWFQNRIEEFSPDEYWESEGIIHHCSPGTFSTSQGRFHSLLSSLGSWLLKFNCVLGL